MTDLIPMVRFKGFKEAWKEYKLSDVADNYKVSNKSVHHPNLLSLSYGKIVQKDIESKKGLLPSSFDTYQIVKDGIIVFRVTDLQNDKKSLRVGISTQEGIITPAYICIECDKNKILPIYLFTLLHYYDVITKIYYKMGDGLRQTLSYKDLKELKVYIPLFEEQKILSELFNQIDEFISNNTYKLERLKQLKSAFLQSMFPQSGETKPRVRFEGFEGEWAKKKMGRIFKERIESNIYGEMLSVTMNQGIIKASQNGRFDNSNSDKSRYKVVKINDIAYNSMRMWQGASGWSPYEGIVSPAYTVLIPESGVISEFFAYLFKSEILLKQFRINSQGLTSDNWNLKYPAFSKIEVLYPMDIREQQQIANFFRSLDIQISLETQRLDKLKQIKSACLDKMFV
ncbi:restriction endonuclease subunit S [Bacteroides sp. 519]|uniref:restriction endonuclease subunit S n=1 Tax=Bacteroides sp. 519 TaxID=2302937 RepID=UPI0013D38E7E|nr:restriction endonuclease subunit S [Bacteroides sp. 519]NDV60470.1 restriction endonuclease subunit S [Bacteroides sp. 519]